MSLTSFELGRLFGRAIRRAGKARDAAVRRIPALGPVARVASLAVKSPVFWVVVILAMAMAAYTNSSDFRVLAKAMLVVSAFLGFCYVLHVIDSSQNETLLHAREVLSAIGTALFWLVVIGSCGLVLLLGLAAKPRRIPKRNRDWFR